MPEFRSEVYIDFFKKKVDYSKNLGFIGSCFADNIGKKLIEAKVPTLLNPFGVLYNPISICECISAILEEKRFTTKNLDFYNEKWISFKHHGVYSGTDKDGVLEKINQNVEFSFRFIKNASILFITFGTAWVYRLKKTGDIVANCHKLPSNEFEHFMLSVSEIVVPWERLIKKLNNKFPDLRLVFTISPVRHWKNGPVNNQLSKSTLFVAVHELIKQFGHAGYFPSYEIMMDDLRDYRFYATDLFHPSQLAVDYIWDKFRLTYFDEGAILVMDKIEKLRRNFEHRVFYPQTNAYKVFIMSNLKLIEELAQTYPKLNFEKEKTYFIQEGKLYFADFFNHL